ncbi:MAG: alpha/beta hydrolase domain-containing protein [Vicinamibacterales bacterium]
MQRPLTICGILLLVAQVASAEVVRIDVQRRDDFGTYERVIGRVRFAVDPDLPANRGIADLILAPKNAEGKVEFSSDVLFFRPKADRARGTVFLEVVNRGRDQSLVIMSGAVQRDMAPASWNLGDEFLLQQGFTVAFLGWQFNTPAYQGLTFEAPVVPVEGLVRESYIEVDRSQASIFFSLQYCAYGPARPDATLTYRARMDDTPKPFPRTAWQFADDGCSLYLGSGSGVGIYEVLYQAKESPVAGLGLAAVRDFGSYLRNGAAGAALRENPAALQRIIGYGYSQSARFLREFVRDGFNVDERGRAVFDGLMISSAGAGGGSFNHRFAMPEQSGNSVLSVLRPVDLPPFTDAGLLARAQAARVTPKIFYTFTSNDYWSRAGSLTHTGEEGRADVPLAPTSRLYFLAGTADAPGPLPLTRRTIVETFQHFMNFAQARWVTRALLLDLDAWTRNESEPPPSQYPSISKGELVTLRDVRFPAIPRFSLAAYIPPVWRMDFGATFDTVRVISNEPPRIGTPYQLLVPQVNADGNDVSGIRLPEVAVPLGTYTGWNLTIPEYRDLRYLSGLVGGFEPFPRTKEDRTASRDERLSIAERYNGPADYLAKVQRAADDLVRQRFLRREDVPAVLQRAEQVWSVVMGLGSQ